jgi:hypothetical protein
MQHPKRILSKVAPKPKRTMEIAKKTLMTRFAKENIVVMIK